MSGDVVRYLLGRVGLEKDKAYTFWFLDGTGYFGTPEEFAPYCAKRLNMDQHESYEIEGADGDGPGLKGFDLKPGHKGVIIGPPTEEGEELDLSKGKPDQRFED